MCTGAHLHRNFFKHICCAKVGAPFLAVCAEIKTPLHGVLISAQTARKGAPTFAQEICLNKLQMCTCNIDVHICIATFSNNCCAKVGAPFLAVCAEIKTPCNGVLISAQTARKGAPHFCTTNMFEKLMLMCTGAHLHRNFFKHICCAKVCAPFLAVCAEIKTPLHGVLISAQTARKGAPTFAQQICFWKKLRCRCAHQC